jgi:DNA-binding winged helix-turn-helix (wHTH) protein
VQIGRELISKDAILKAVWPGRMVEEGNISVQLTKLRRILDQNRGEGSSIRTFPGRGYCFVLPVTQLHSGAPPDAQTTSEVGARPLQRFSIVVLPFDNLSRDLAQQYLADGITEDLTTNLSRFTDMLVISRNTAFTYRDKPRDATPPNSTQGSDGVTNAKPLAATRAARTGDGPHHHLGWKQSSGGGFGGQRPGLRRAMRRITAILAQDRGRRFQPNTDSAARKCKKSAGIARGQAV